MRWIATRTRQLGQFTGLSTACYSCHQKDFQTPVLDHVSAGFPTTCESCHTMDTWFNAKFDHLKVTGYALTGAHVTLPCTSCHLNNVFGGRQRHVTAATQRISPTATTLRMRSLAAARLRHVPLHNRLAERKIRSRGIRQLPVDRHACDGDLRAVPYKQQLHVDPTACYACHKADFSGTTNPNHVTAGFPTDCTLCHTTSGWSPSTFNHSATYVPTHRRAYHRALRSVPHEQQLHDTAHRLLRVPPGRLHTEPTTHRTCRRASPQTCATCHNTTSWTSRPSITTTLRSRLPARTPRRLRAVPHQQQLHDAAHDLLLGATRPTSLAPTIPPTWPPVSPPTARSATPPATGRLHFQSRSSLPAHRRARHRRLRAVPHQQQLHNTAHDLLRLPSGGFQRHHKSESRRGRLPHHLRHLPHHDQLDHRHFQSCDVRQLSADRSARHADLRPVPHQQQLHSHVRRHATRATRRISPEPPIPTRLRGLPDRLLDLPLDHRVEPVVLQSQQTSFPLTGVHMTMPARSATRTTTTQRCPPPATAAIRPTGTEPPIPTTRPPASPPPATHATPPPPGPAQPSITTTRPSR